MSEELDWLREWIRSRLSPESIAAFEEDAPLIVPPAVTFLGLTPFGWAVIAGIALVAGVSYGAYQAEKNTPLAQPTSGTPCGATSGPALQAATTLQTVTVRAVGGNSSWNKAYAQAQAVCLANWSSACSGGCPGGGTCTPNVSVQTSDQYWRFLWTTTVLTFNCPCECL